VIVEDSVLFKECVQVVASLFKQPRQASLYTCGFNSVEGIDSEYSLLQIFHLGSDDTRLIRWVDSPDGLFELYDRDNIRFVFFQQHNTEVSAYFILSKDFNRIQ
jgi:hypothetical protein